MEVKNIIFDMDGTLLDSMGMWYDVGKNFLVSKGIEPPEGISERVKPMSLRQVWEYLRGTFAIVETYAEFHDAIFAIVGEYYANRPKFKANVVERLEQWRAEGIRMCIASATFTHLLYTALDKLDARKYFDFAISCHDVGFGKDRPDIYERCLMQMGGTKEDTVVIEDALHGVRTAKLAGFKVVAIYDEASLCDASEIKKYCDSYVEGFADIDFSAI